jgi:DNA-binding MarR family transcriptional regulator
MSDNLGFLLGDVARLLRCAFDERAREIGVTRAQWKTLVVLSRNEGSNQGTLADLLEIEPITLARMIDRLEEAGLVERRRDPADRRAWRLHLTAAAQPLMIQLRAIGDTLLEDVLAGISPAGRDGLHATLEHLRSNLNTPNFKEAANG